MSKYFTPVKPPFRVFKRKVLAKAAKVSDFVYQIGEVGDLRKPSQLIPVKKITSDAIKAKIASQMTNYALTQTTLSIEQAFLGLIANGYDAMLASQPSHSTYGIGFFLALRFLTLNETKGTKIIIDTIYRNDDISLSAYTMLLTHDKHPLTQTEDIHIAITPFNPKKTISQTGTTISILPILQDRRFSTELLKKIDDYIKPLSPDLPILITHGMHQEIRGTLAKIHENNAQGDA